MPLTKDAVTEALKGVPGPVPGSDLAEGGYLRHIAACDGHASIKLKLPSGASREDFEQTAEAAHRAVLAKAHVGGYRVEAFAVEFVDDADKVVHNVKFGPPPNPIPAGTVPRQAQQP